MKIFSHFSKFSSSNIYKTSERKLRHSNLTEKTLLVSKINEYQPLRRKTFLRCLLSLGHIRHHKTPEGFYAISKPGFYIQWYVHLVLYTLVLTYLLPNPSPVQMLIHQLWNSHSLTSGKYLNLSMFSEDAVPLPPL